MSPADNRHSNSQAKQLDLPRIEAMNDRDICVEVTQGSIEDSEATIGEFVDSKFSQAQPHRDRAKDVNQQTHESDGEKTATTLSIVC